jgi:hypothetical protein
VPFPTFRIELQKTKHDDGLDTPTHFGPAYDEPFAATASPSARRGPHAAGARRARPGDAKRKRYPEAKPRIVELVDNGDDTASWKVRR